MEGRTIVRPDYVDTEQLLPLHTSFNGGPDNRPARLGTLMHSVKNTTFLQWRAGQSSGQTLSTIFSVFPLRCPFNGGPDNRPARQIELSRYEKARPFLQWRAGQSSGQTTSSVSVETGDSGPSMEGRTIVRPDDDTASGA